MKALRHTIATMLALLGGAAAAAPGDIVFIAPTNHTMPFAQFQDGALQGGILKDLGQAIGARMGLKTRFVSVPSKRVGLALAAGSADAVCYVMPGWIDGDFHWSVPFIPNDGAVVAQADAPPIRNIGDLAGLRVGTVLGYHYPQLEKALGSTFKRDDAPSMQHNLNKMAARRMQYAVIEQTTLSYYRRISHDTQLRTALVFISFKAQCAFSRKSRIPLAEADRAIVAIAASGAVDAIMAQYR